ncbi:MAG: tRNA (adenosine(37)-N6)-dimethylallyltransferase MiaA [Lawsonibacter sp.]|nr:tRNA (adenosine(37)-N6)-dimethylallyltransferase MiaA [Lawsonibacter sp.]
MAQRILAVVGPTAAGKTRLAVELALRCSGEVVSADSMQIYRSMDIGTAKPTREEMRGIPHHMLDVAEPGEEFSVARYVEQARACVEDILARGRLPIVAGGTGLYVDSLLSGRTFAPHYPDSPLRAELQRRAREAGTVSLWKELKSVDPEAAALLHANDEKRVIRALEVWYQTGRTITQHNRESRAAPPRYQALIIGLAFRERPDMWARIDRRTDAMMAAGLEGEVRALLDRGVPLTCTAMQAIGYKELARAMLSGGSATGAAEEIKLRTRQYAKRQLTWFKRNQEIRWHFWAKEPDFPAAVLASTEYMEEFGLV